MFPNLNWPAFQPIRSDGQLEEILSSLEESGLYISDHFVDLTAIAALKQYAQIQSDENMYHPSAIGKKSAEQLNRAVRSDSIFWVDEFTGPLQVIGDWLECLSTEIRNHFRISLSKIESHFSIYSPGAHYDKHKDNSFTENERQFTFIYYLNPDWKTGDGGELVIYDPSDSHRKLHTIAPKAGTFILFRSELFYHEVLKSNFARYTYSGWLRR